MLLLRLLGCSRLGSLDGLTKRSFTLRPRYDLSQVRSAAGSPQGTLLEGCKVLGAEGAANAQHCFDLLAGQLGADACFATNAWDASADSELSQSVARCAGRLKEHLVSKVAVEKGNVAAHAGESLHLFCQAGSRVELPVLMTFDPQ